MFALWLGPGGGHRLFVSAELSQHKQSWDKVRRAGSTTTKPNHSRLSKLHHSSPAKSPPQSTERWFILGHIITLHQLPLLQSTNDGENPETTVDDHFRWLFLVVKNFTRAILWHFPSTAPYLPSGCWEKLRKVLADLQEPEPVWWQERRAWNPSDDFTVHHYLYVSNYQL